MQQHYVLRISQPVNFCGQNTKSCNFFFIEQYQALYHPELSAENKETQENYIMCVFTLVSGSVYFKYPSEYYSGPTSK